MDARRGQCENHISKLLWASGWKIAGELHFSHTVSKNHRWIRIYQEDEKCIHWKSPVIIFSAQGPQCQLLTPEPLVHMCSSGAELRLCTMTPKMLHLNLATGTPVSRWIQNEKYSVKQLTSTGQCHNEKKRNVLEQSYLRDITFKRNEKSLTGFWVNTKHERNVKIKQLWQCQRSTLIFQQLTLKTHRSVICMENNSNTGWLA